MMLVYTLHGIYPLCSVYTLYYVVGSTHHVTLVSYYMATSYNIWLPNHNVYSGNSVICGGHSIIYCVKDKICGRNFIICGCKCIVCGGYFILYGGKHIICDGNFIICGRKVIICGVCFIVYGK